MPPGNVWEAPVFSPPSPLSTHSHPGLNSALRVNILSLFLYKFVYV